MSLRILHYSDLENVYDDPRRVGRLAGLISQLRDEDTLLAGTGDNTAPGVLSLVTDGRHALDFFDAIEPDVDTLGNHDFDHGLEATRALIRDSPQTWVSANVRYNGGRFGEGEGIVPTTVTRCNGSRVGFFGVTDPRTPSINPVASELEVTDPIAAASEAVEALRAEGVDYVVALSHLGKGDDELAARVDVDCVLGGHVHTERVDRLDGTLLTRPGANGNAVLEVELDGESTAATRHRVADARCDELVADALRDRMARTGLDEVVATVDEPIERTERTAFGGESRIGNWVADAYRYSTGADVGLQNSGGIRTGPSLSGEVTVADCIGVAPFEEPITVASITGRELRALLAQADGSAVEMGEPHWWHAHVSGLSVVWDDERGEPASIRVGGEPIELDATYTLATSDYLFHTDHEFPVLTGDHREASHGTQYEVLVEYARARGIDAAVEGRIVGRGQSGRNGKVDAGG